jgi:hypothetical protein
MGWAWNTSETHRRCHSFRSRLRTFKRYSLFRRTNTCSTSCFGRLACSKAAWTIQACSGIETQDLLLSNFAVTAAHCADWAWSAAGPETKTFLGKEFDFRVTGEDRHDVVAFCDALEEINRDFYICRKLANGAKHMRRGKQSHQVHALVEFSPRSFEVEGDI